MRTKFYLAAAAATAAAVATSANATPGTASATATAKGTVLLPLTLTNTSDLNFGTVVASGTAGTVTIDSGTGNRSVSGGVTAVSTDVGGNAVFSGAGAANQAVILSLSPPATLLSGTNTVAVNSMTFDTPTGVTNSQNATTGAWSSSRNLDNTGALKFGVGGVFGIAANQANGVYTNTFTVTADYQ